MSLLKASELKMKIKTVEYSALINLGNYNNERIGFTAQLEEGETVEEVIDKLRQMVKENGGVDADQLYNRIYDGKQKLKALEEKTLKARQAWEQTAEFLKAQGLRPDAPSMPMFSNLLPEAKEERVVEAEIDDENRFF